MGHLSPESSQGAVRVAVLVIATVVNACFRQALTLQAHKRGGFADLERIVDGKGQLSCGDVLNPAIVPPVWRRRIGADWERQRSS